MRWGVGAGASRLVSGTMTIHRRLEERLAEFKHRENALLFGSGFLANAGVIAALARPGDVVFSDELNHASIIDGCRLSRAEVFVYDHLDVEHLAWGIENVEGRGALIVTDGVFSMEGDVADLPRIVELCRAHGARLMVDEAHGAGVLGARGAGASELLGVEREVDLRMGTFSKSLASCGGFIAGSHEVIDFLRVSSRAFLFTAAAVPAAVGAALAALRVIRSPEGPELFAHPATAPRSALAEPLTTGRTGSRATSFCGCRQLSARATCCTQLTVQ